MSRLRKIYFARLAGRVVAALLTLALYLARREAFDVLRGWNFFLTLSPLHVLWAVWIVDMVGQLVPVQKNIALGSQKMYRHRFCPIVEAINYKALKEHIVRTTKAAYKVFLIWVLLLAVLAALTLTGALGYAEILLVAVLFFVCDLICVLIWCPFRLIMRNKCCTTCRIFNWDHLMMFSPFVLTPGFYTTSLLVVAFAAWVVWEVCVMIYPERFWENSNDALKCANCTDKLCTQYCKKLRNAQAGTNPADGTRPR